jgi:hypothetical protein
MSGAVAFGGLLVLAVLAGRCGRWAAVLLAVGAVGSLFVNRSMEGRVLRSFPGDHGLTAGDLVSLTGFLLAVGLFVFPRKH